MRDEDCIAFLQMILPRLQMRWPGFRKVRSQVCKRLQRRLHVLSLNEIEDYQQYLHMHQTEWHTLDTICRITISSFYRDQAVFRFLECAVLPELAQRVSDRGYDRVKVWCVGISSGEEPYTLMLLWKFACQSRFADLRLQLTATDADVNMLQRATEASYSFGSLKNLPEGWRKQAFLQHNNAFQLKPEYRTGMRFLLQDVREQMPDEMFDLIMCRNLVCTYYDEALQVKLLEQMAAHLTDHGALVLGIHETMPAGITKLKAWSERLRIYRKV